MSKVIGFNYAGIKDPNVRKLARENAAAIKDLREKEARYVVEIGKRLLAIKKVMSHADFKAWRTAEFGFNQSTTNNYMLAAEKFGDVKCLDNFQPTAMYRLSRQNVPEDLVDEFIERATNGEKVTETKTIDALRSRNVPKGRQGRAPTRLILSVKDRTSLEDAVDQLRRAVPYLSAAELSFLSDWFLERALECRRAVPSENSELQPVA